MNTSTPKILLPAIALTSMILGSCAGSDPVHEAAVALDESIDSAMTANNYALAIELIDSLNKTYNLEIDLRKASDTKRAKAYEGLSVTEIPRLDSLISVTKYEISVAEGEFVSKQPSASLPTYLVLKSAAKSDFAAAAGVQGRVNTGDDARDTPWTLAVNAGRDIGLERVDITCSDGAKYTLSTPVSDGQMASISPESAETLAQHLYDNPSVQATSIVFTGSKGNTKATLSEAQSASIAQAWNLAKLNSRLYSALVERERVERQLQIARDQLANTPATAE